MTRNQLKTSIYTAMAAKKFNSQTFYIDDVLFKLDNKRLYMYSNVFNSWIYVHLDCFTDAEMFVLQDIIKKELF